jgi:hypothetical protein
MPVEITQGLSLNGATRLKRIAVVEDTDGHELVLGEKDQLVQDEFVSVTCDGPRCATGPNGERARFSWSAQQVAQDPNAMPDGAYRLVVNSSFTGEKHVFCSVRCEHDWQLQSYKPPLSPRELTALAQNNAQAAPETPAAPLDPTKIVAEPPDSVPDATGDSSLPAEGLNPAGPTHF